MITVIAREVDVYCQTVTEFSWALAELQSQPNIEVILEDQAALHIQFRVTITQEVN